MRHSPVLLLSMIIVLLICAPSAAHPGRTDENGGHRDSSTGEYHYHHGYPAHQHENGICPYDYDDRTGWSSGSSSGSVSSGYRYSSGSTRSAAPILSTPRPTPTATFLPVSMSQASETPEAGPFEFGVGILICLILFLCIAFANRRAARNLHENQALGCLTHFVVMIFILALVCLIGSCDINRTAEIFRSSKKLVPLLCIFVLYAILATVFLISEWKYEDVVRREAANMKLALENKTREAVKLKEFIDASGIADPDRMIPAGSKIGDDGLPCESTPDQRFRWGETYTFFASRYGIAFHRYGCESSGNACQCNALHVYGKKRACRVCNPVLPDLSWYFEYQKRKEMQDIIP